MNIESQIILKENITDFHRMIFVQLLKEQGRVKGDLYLRADRCKLIGFVIVNDKAIGCGGIKENNYLTFQEKKQIRIEGLI